MFPLKATKLHLQKYLFLLQELKTCRHYFFFSHIKPCLSIFSFFYVLGSFLCNFRIPIGLYLRSNMKDIFFYHPFGGLSLIKRELWKEKNSIVGVKPFGWKMATNLALLSARWKVLGSWWKVKSVMLRHPIFPFW